MPEKLVSQIEVKNKLNIFIIIFISHVVTQIANASVLQWTYNKIEPLQISQQTLIRLENYLSGNFYSYTFDKKVTNATSLYFAISQNGFGSVLSYCEDEKINCIASVAKYQTLYRCKKKFKEDCYILAVDNSLIIQNKIHVINKNNVKKELDNISHLININKNKTTKFTEDDIHYYSRREVGDEDYN